MKSEISVPVNLAVFSVCLVVLACSWAATFSEAKSNVECPSKFPCSCRPLKREDYYILYVDCRATLRNGQIPDLSPFRGMPIGHMDFRENNIKEIKADTFDGITFKGVKASLEMTEPLLCLGSNPLTEISADSFRGSVANRLVLHIRNATLTRVPDLKDVQNLVYLDVSENQIEDIPADTFKGLSRMKGLNLANNPLRGAVSESYAGLEPSLEEIDLSNTGLREFPSNVFKTFKRLLIMNLNHNLIHSLPSDVFHDFQTDSDEVEVYLSDNRIKRVAVDALKNTPSSRMRISELHLENNKLSDLDFLFEGCHLIVDRFTHIELSGNPITCNCDFYDFARIGFFSEMHGECFKPEDYHGVAFHVVRPSRTSTAIAGEFSAGFGRMAEQNCPRGNMSSWDVSCLMGYLSVDDPKEGKLSGGDRSVALHHSLVLVFFFQIIDILIF